MIDKKRKVTSGREGIENAEVNIGLQDVLKGTGNLIDIVTNLKKEGESGMVSLEDIKDLKGNSKGLFGVLLKTNIGGVVTTEEVIGKIPIEGELPTNKGVREPLADVFVEGDCIEIIAELPGLEEKDIMLEIKGGNTLSLYSVSDKRKYRKEIPLSFPVSVNDIQSVCKNGILKLRLKRLV